MTASPAVAAALYRYDLEINEENRLCSLQRS